MTNPILAEVGVLAPVVLAAVGKFVWTYIQAKFKPNQLVAIQHFAQQAVHAAEESGLAGPAKLSMASGTVASLAGRLGVKLSASETASFVNAALQEARLTGAIAPKTVPAAAAA
jgi:hypothetical protein